MRSSAWIWLFSSTESTTAWAGGVPPSDPEVAVRAAKAEAEVYAAQHHPSAPDEARAAKEDGKGLGGNVKDMLGLP